MAALSAAVQRDFVGNQDEIPVLLTDSDTYYEGAIIVAASGKGKVAAAAADKQPILGILTTFFDDGDRTNAKVIGSSNTVSGKVKRGKVWLPHASAAQTDVGGLFVPSNDNDMTDVPTTATKRYYAYMALAFRTGELLFDLRAPVCADNETA